MAQIIINIPDEHMSRIANAFAGAYGWQPGDKETKPQHAKRRVIEYVKQVTKDYELTTSQNSARQTVENEVSVINVT